MSLQKSLTLLNLTGVAVDANGTWLPAGDLQAPYSVHVSGAGAGDTILICGSNRPTQPANTEHEYQIASVAADGFTTIAGTVRWLKARKTAATKSSSAFVAGIVP